MQFCRLQSKASSTCRALADYSSTVKGSNCPSDATLALITKRIRNLCPLTSFCFALACGVQPRVAPIAKQSETVLPRCQLVARAEPPQELPQLAGFLGGPAIFVKQAAAPVARAYVSLDASGVAKATLLPEAFSDHVRVTTSHVLLFRFDYTRQIDNLVVARRGGPDVTGQAEGISQEMLFDAVDGPAHSTLAAKYNGADISLLAIDAVGHISELVPAVTGHTAIKARIAATGPRSVDIAWLEPNAEGSQTQLWFARFDWTSRRVVSTLIDTAPELQRIADLTLTHSLLGTIVAWNPIVANKVTVRARASGGQERMLPVELRTFRIPADGRPRQLSRTSLEAMTGTVASVGGFIVPNYVQAVAFADDALLTWQNGGRLYASLVTTWQPIDIGEGKYDPSPALLSLGPRSARLVWNTEHQVPPDSWWPTLQQISVTCAADRSIL